MADYDATLRDAMEKLSEVIFDACGDIMHASDDVIRALYKSAQEGVDATVENAGVFDAETQKLAAADSIDVTRNVEVLRAYLDFIHDQAFVHFEPMLEYVGWLVENKMKDSFMLDPAGEQIFHIDDMPAYSPEKIARMIMTDYEFKIRIDAGMSIDEAIADYCAPMADASLYDAEGYRDSDRLRRDSVDISSLKPLFGFDD